MQKHILGHDEYVSVLEAQEQQKPDPAVLQASTQYQTSKKAYDDGQKKVSDALTAFKKGDTDGAAYMAAVQQYLPIVQKFMVDEANYNILTGRQTPPVGQTKPEQKPPAQTTQQNPATAQQPKPGVAS